MNKVCRIMVIIGVFMGLSFGEAMAEKSILRYTQAFPTNIDPALGEDFSSTRALTALYDTLVYPDGEGSPQPCVAEKWESSSDGKTWTFHLRSGVKFHDGTKLTAEDVKFSVDRLTTMGTGYAFLFADKIVSTEVVDKQIVRIQLREPFGPFLYTLYRLYIVNKDLVFSNIKRPGPYGELGDYGTSFLVTHDAGSGPYIVKEFRPEEHLLIKKFSGYWGYVNPNAPDEVKQIGTTEPVTVRTMMSRRELEISDQWQSTEALSALDKIKGIDIAKVPVGGMFYYMMNTKKSPTDDIHFRKAIAWAVDYEMIKKKIFPGFTQARGPIPPELPGSDPTLFQYHFDLDKAREELKQSKYYNKLDQYPVELHWVSEVPSEEKIALLIQANLAKIGIDAKVIRDPWMVVVEYMARQETSPHLIPMSISADYPETGALLTSKYSSGATGTVNQNEWLLDPEYDAMLKDALATLDVEERFAKYSKLQHYIVDLCPTIFLVDGPHLHAYQSTYIDWPAARGEGIPVLGYALDPRWIKVYPDKRAELLK